MSQTAYNNNMDAAYAGMLANIDPMTVHAHRAQADLAFGRAACAEAGDNVTVRFSAKDNGKIILDADLIAANVVNGKVNGNAIAAVTYATSHLNTMGLVIAAILAADSGVTAVLDPADTNNRTIIVENTDGSVISFADWAVTGGVSQAGITHSYSADDVFRGVIVHRHTKKGYPQANESVDVLTKGQVWVETGVAVNADDAAYVDVTGGIGKFTNVSTANIATGGKFRSTVGAAGLAILEVNLP